MPSIAVVGSVNLDLVASVSRLPQAGETVTGASLNRYPGGKGANQALAARRLGAEVALVARVGDDAAATEALALLVQDGVDLTRCIKDPAHPTGLALIAVSADGENQIVVVPGANALLVPASLDLPTVDAVICQLEVPMKTIGAVAAQVSGFFALNIAPAMPVPVAVLRRADLVVMNESEAQVVGEAISECLGWVATTYGAGGARLTKVGVELVAAVPPKVTVVDTTGAGDTFTAALVLALVEGTSPRAALEFACAAGALATTRCGAQPSFPWRQEVHGILSAV
jgi:ribokinase